MADLGGWGVDGFGRTPFFASNPPWKPGNGVSDVPDFKIFGGGANPRTPLASRAFGAHKFESSFSNPGFAPEMVRFLQ